MKCYFWGELVSIYWSVGIVQKKKKKMKERNECDHVAITKNTNYLSAITRFTLKGLVKLQLESSMTLGKSLIGIALRSLQSAFST